MLKILDVSLREKKFALKKVEILKIMLEKTETKSLDELSIKEISDVAMISEGTFFNYFPKKTDLLVYFIQMWSIEAVYLTERKYGKTSGLKKIESFIQHSFNNETIGNNRIMYEILSYQALNAQGIYIDLKSISDAEKIIAFPYHNDIEKLELTSFENIIIDYIIQAIELGELPKHTDVGKLMIILGSLFFGLPLVLKKHPEMLADSLSSTLQAIWTALKAEGR
jgi:AcrR family transcriptional regulator